MDSSTVKQMQIKLDELFSEFCDMMDCMEGPCDDCKVQEFFDYAINELDKEV